MVVLLTLNLVWTRKPMFLWTGKKVVKIAESIDAGDAQVIDATGLVVASWLGGYPC